MVVIYYGAKDGKFVDDFNVSDMNVSATQQLHRFIMEQQMPKKKGVYDKERCEQI